ncbi:MAG TPA: hypothetical protein VG328_18740 [Stellaceae bacterium]|jgi:hypothetical protein|nr:hypothetical protein [Stellaceae bacterium]
MDVFTDLLATLQSAIKTQSLGVYEILGLIVVGLGLAAFLWSRFRPVTIKIISPARSAWVPPVYYVHGSSSPRRVPLQVLVYSPATRKWHPQAPVEWEDAVHWRARCGFDDENMPPAAEFKIVALRYRASIAEALDELPAKAPQSKIINVSRRRARQRGDTEAISTRPQEVRPKVERRANGGLRSA